MNHKSYIKGNIQAENPSCFGCAFRPVYFAHEALSFLLLRENTVITDYLKETRNSVKAIEVFIINKCLGSILLSCTRHSEGGDHVVIRWFGHRTHSRKTFGLFSSFYIVLDECSPFVGRCKTSAKHRARLKLLDLNQTLHRNN